MATRTLTEQTLTEQAAITNLARTCVTSHPRDRAAVAVLIRGASTDELRRFTIATLKSGRRAWLDWLTTTQREWQRNARAVHVKRNLRSRTARQQAVGAVYAGERGREVARRCLVEAIATRERYVRCGQ